MVSMSRTRVVIAVTALSVLTAACGTRQSHDQVVSALRGGAVTGDQSGTSLNSGSTPGSGAAGAIAPSGAATGPAAGGTGSTTLKGSAGQAGPAAAASSGPQAASKSGDHTPLLIGEVGTFSGIVGAAGVPNRAALRAWVQATNASGGLLGHQVQLISIDDQGNTSKAQAAVRRLVEEQHVVAIVGSFVGLTLPSISKYLNDKHMPMVGGDLSAYGWFQNPMFFPQGTHTALALYGILQSTAAANKPKVALFYCTEAAVCSESRTALRGYSSSAHVQVVYEAQVSLAQPDFTAQCINARSAGAQAVIVVMDGGSLARIGRDCVRQSYHPDFWTGAQVLSDEMKSNPDLDGIQATTQTFGWMLSDSPQQAAYQAAMRRYAPDQPSEGTASMGWTSGELLRAAVTAQAARATSGPITTQLVLDGLYSLHETTLGGLAPESLTYHKGGVNPGARCYWVVQAVKGSWQMSSGGRQMCVPAGVRAP